MKNESPLTVLTANRSRYSNPDVVDNYLQKDHHSIRVDVSIGLLNSMLSLDVANKSDKRVLELAAAGGTISRKIADAGYSVLASDIEEKLLFTINHDRVKTKAFDVCEKFPLENNSFDAIYAGEIIEHVYDVLFFLKECYRILKPNGVLVITTPNLATLNDRIGFLFGRSPSQVDILHPYRYLHIRPLTFEKAEAAFIKIGFVDVHLKSNCVELPKVFNNYRSKTIAKYLPSLGRSVIIAGRKKI